MVVGMLVRWLGRIVHPPIKTASVVLGTLLIPLTSGSRVQSIIVLSPKPGLFQQFVQYLIRPCPKYIRTVASCKGFHFATGGLGTDANPSFKCYK